MRNVYENILKKETTFKYPGMALTIESMLFTLFIIIIAAVILIGKGSALDLYRFCAQELEMFSIETAATSYSGQRRDGEGPTSMQDLIDGVSAQDSITGTATTGLLNADSTRFKNGTYKDCFGSDFVFGTSANGNRYIASPGVDRQPGTDDDIYAWY